MNSTTENHQVRDESKLYTSLTTHTFCGCNSVTISKNNSTSLEVDGSKEKAFIDIKSLNLVGKIPECFSNIDKGTIITANLNEAFEPVVNDYSKGYIVFLNKKTNEYCLAVLGKLSIKTQKGQNLECAIFKCRKKLQLVNKFYYFWDDSNWKILFLNYNNSTEAIEFGIEEGSDWIEVKLVNGNFVSKNHPHGDY